MEAAIVAKGCGFIRGRNKKERWYFKRQSLFIRTAEIFKTNKIISENTGGL